jgi:hypothetical protein
MLDTALRPVVKLGGALDQQWIGIAKAKPESASGRLGCDVLSKCAPANEETRPGGEVKREAHQPGGLVRTLVRFPATP